MAASVKAQGHTNVIMVMNMNRFIHPDDRQRFQALRGSNSFHNYIREHWQPALLESNLFIPVDEDYQRRGKSQRMSIAEVGFATGVFRQSVLERYMFPTYRINKDAYKFPSSLEHNFQFRQIFKPIWDSWDIYVRPSVLGMLNIRLTKEYKKAAPLEQITSDAIRLQASFDIPSAIHWLDKLKKELGNDEVSFIEKQESVEELLNWLGSSIQSSEEVMDYSPVQWQLAMEIGRGFVQTIGKRIPLENREVRLWNPPPNLSHPLHDSYVIHHLDAVYASPYILPSYREKMDTDGGSEKTYDNKKRLVQVRFDDLQNSFTVKQRLLNMLEGSILRQRTPQDGQSPTRYFPKLKQSRFDTFLEKDLSTWSDELCLMNSRIALIMPSHEDKQSNLFVSTLPTTITTSHIQYLWYWDAVERMVEFTAEIRVLAQLLEHDSTKLLQHCVDLVHQKRQDVLTEDNQMLMSNFMQTIERTANLSRLLAICQTLDNAATWSRADFAMGKAAHMLEQFSVHVSIQHAAENLSNLNALLEHLDELNLSDEQKTQERINSRISVGFSAVSMGITLLILPSFWVDLAQLSSTWNKGFLRVLKFSGNILATIVLVLSVILFTVSISGLIKGFSENHRSH